MILRTSSNSINPSLKMFGQTFRKNLGLLILTVAGVLLVCPGYLLIYLENDYFDASNIQGVLENWVSALTIALAVCAVIGVCIYNIINFSYLYSKKSSDVFHSLPLSRNELIASRGFAGLVLTLVPVATGFLSLCVVLLIKGASARAYFGLITGIVCILLSTAAVWSMSLFFTVCAGSAFDNVISFTGVNAGLVIMGFIISSILSNFLPGYNGINSNAANLSPVYYCISSVASFSDIYIYRDRETISAILSFGIKALIMFAVFTAASFALYNRRKAEKSGNGYAYRFVYVICAFIAAFCGGTVFGALFSENNMLRVSYYLFALAGAAITAVAFGAVTDRGFKNYKSSLIIGGCAFLSLVIIIGLVRLDLFGYKKRIPDKSRIKSAAVTVYDDTGIQYNTDDVINLHKSIVENNAAVSQIARDSSYRQSVDIVYHLKNGKTVKRNYFVDVLSVRKELFELYSSDERFNLIVNTLKRVNPDTVYFDYTYNEESCQTYLTYAEFSKLIELYRSELGGKDDILTYSKGCFTAQIYETDKHNNIEIRTNTSEMFFDDTFKETVKYLESLDLPKRSEETKNAE